MKSHLTPSSAMYCRPVNGHPASSARFAFESGNLSQGGMGVVRPSESSFKGILFATQWVLNRDYLIQLIIQLQLSGKYRRCPVLT